MRYFEISKESLTNFCREDYHDTDQSVLVDVCGDAKCDQLGRRVNQQVPYFWNDVFFQRKSFNSHLISIHLVQRFSNYLNPSRRLDLSRSSK